MLIFSPSRQKCVINPTPFGLYCLRVINSINSHVSTNKIRQNIIYYELIFWSISLNLNIKWRKKTHTKKWRHKIIIKEKQLYRAKVKFIYLFVGSPKPMVRRPSVLSVVRRRPHFQTWISLKSVCQSWSNFMCSITGVGERLHKILGRLDQNSGFYDNRKPPLTYNWENDVSTFSRLFWSHPFYTCR